MYSRTIRCFILSILFFPAAASAVSCDAPTSSFCEYFSFSSSCPSGTSTPISTVTSCSTSNVIGTCTYSYGGATFWYARNGITASSATSLAQSCASGGYGTWSAGNVVAIAPTTPLPPPPTTQTVFAAPTGKLPTAAVSVSPSGTFGNATLAVTLDLSKVLAGGSFAGLGQFAAGYNIYVAALVPSGALGLSSATWFVLPATRTWAQLGSPIAAYMQGLAPDATDRVVISILSGLDVTGLVGAEIYIGYGLSDTEMLAANRYRGIYKVQ
jgi:hypothetical protein